MATTTMTFTLKLLVDKQGNKVLFAEASNEFVDFLFYILSLQVGTIVSLLTKKNMVGCLGNLYGSIENLSTNYIQPNFNKDCILKPKVVNANYANLLMLPNVDQSSTCKNFYLCSDCSQCFSDDPTAMCPICEKRRMLSSLNYVASNSVSNTSNSTSVGKDYVKEVVTYLVMDDLVVKSRSTISSIISSITLLNTFNIKDIGLLEEKEVTFGMDEAVKLIKASLESKTVLTDVFLEKKSSAQNSSSASQYPKIYFEL